MSEEQMMKELCEEMGIRWIPEKGHSTIRGIGLTAEQFADVSYIPDSTTGDVMTPNAAPILEPHANASFIITACTNSAAAA